MAEYKNVYEYTRNIKDGKYDLENEFIDLGETHEIYPSDAIEATFPGNKFRLFGEDKMLKCCFETALSAPEKSQLDTIINDDRKVL